MVGVADVLSCMTFGNLLRMRNIGEDIVHTRDEL